MKKAKTSIRVSVIVVFVAIFAFSKFYPAFGQTVKPRSAKQWSLAKAAKYTEFPHNAKAHQIECGKCHKFPSDNWNKVRTGSAAFPDITDYPKHQSCMGCHKQQFFRGTPPKICSICHTNPSPGDSSRHPYPNPRELFDQSPKGKNAQSDFVVGFPHDKHIEIVSANMTEPAFVNAAFARPSRFTAGEESCAVCHKTMAPQGKSNEEYLTKPPADLGDAFWLKKGTFKSSPIGHTVCFTCHTADTGILPVPETCSACHHLKSAQPVSDFDPELAAKMITDDKVMKDAWQIRHSAGKFAHEFFAHADLSCSTCHSVATMNTADPTTIKVPIAACATCHVTPTSDDGGALNYEMDKRKESPAFQCVKCHIAFGKLSVPNSHVEAIKAAAVTPAPTSKSK
jgi:hypothetical protein